MASAQCALASRASSIAHTTRFFRFPCSFISSFSTSTAATPAAAAGDGANPTETKPRRKKKKNLFEVAQFLPNWGIGYHLAKTHWKNVSYEITKINLYKDGRHGKAWGIAYKDGVAAEAPKKMSGVHKRCWKYIPNFNKKIANESIPPSPVLEAAA